MGDDKCGRRRLDVDVDVGVASDERKDVLTARWERVLFVRVSPLGLFKYEVVC